MDDDSLYTAALGVENEWKVGTQLDEATDEFIRETQKSRALQIAPGETQLTALDFVKYLGIDLQLEPELSWIAREMLAAPMPPGAEMRISKSGVIYFHDQVNDYFTIEHPLTQRYLKVLERGRLDLLVFVTKPSVGGLLFRQPDILFHSKYRNLQIPCQSCNVVQSTVRCNQCLMSFCQACFDLLHGESGGPRKHHTYVTTAVGSLCSTCSVKKPQVFCASCADYYCFKCFEAMHKRGNRTEHKSMLINVSDGEIVEPQKRCEECEDNPAAFACDFCQDNFCIQCYWKCHFNGHRRTHTASKISVAPLCNQCNNVRGTVFCEQCQELMCTECFTFVHSKGNRMVHLFLDGMDLLMLLERLDPVFQEHLRRVRQRVIWAITNLQGWTRGIEERRRFRLQRDMVTRIQRNYRGVLTRRKLLNMLHLYKWRRRQVNHYFLPKDRAERFAARQRATRMLANKDVTQRAAKTAMAELRDTILETAGADPLEDVDRTHETVREKELLPRTPALAPSSSAPAGGLAMPMMTGILEDTRFSGASGTGNQALAASSSTLVTRDIRDQRDTTLREITRLDPPAGGS